MHVNRKDTRIAFYCSSLSWGGLEINTLRYARWMQDAGYQVCIYTPAGTPLHDAAVRTGIPLRKIRRNRKYLDLSAAIQISRMFRADDMHVVWFRDTRDMDVLGWARRFAMGKIKLIYQQAMQFGISKRDPFHTFRFRAIDIWVSTLDFLAEQVRTQTHFPAARIRVIPLGSDILVDRSSRDQVRSSWNIPPGGTVAGVFGRLDPLKDQLCAIRALHLLHARYPGMHLIIAGSSTRNEGNDYERMLRRHVHQLDLQDHVHFIPHSDRIHEWYAALDLFLLTSRGETFGTVTIEAMHFGLPIAGTNSSGTPELLEHGHAGLLYEPGNADELSQCCMRYLESPELARSTGEYAAQRARRLYSKEASVAGMAAVVDDLIR